MRKETARRLKAKIKDKHRRAIESGGNIDCSSMRLEAEITDSTAASNSTLLPPIIRKSKIVSDGIFSVPYEQRETTKTIAEMVYEKD